MLRYVGKGGELTREDAFSRRVLWDFESDGGRNMEGASCIIVPQSVHRVSHTVGTMIRSVTHKQNGGTIQELQSTDAWVVKEGCMTGAHTGSYQSGR